MSTKKEIRTPEDITTCPRCGNLDIDSQDIECDFGEYIESCVCNRCGLGVKKVYCVVESIFEIDDAEDFDDSYLGNFTVNIFEEE